MPEPQLTESEVAEIEARHAKADSIIEDFYASEFAVAASLNDIPALIRDWRALRSFVTAVGRRCDDLDVDNRRLDSENAALREQLAGAEKEVRGVIETLCDDAVHVHEDGGAEDIYGTLAVSVIKLQKERDALRERVAQFERDQKIGNKPPMMRRAEEIAADIVREWSEHDMDESVDSAYLQAEFGAGHLEERIALALTDTATSMRTACVEKVKERLAVLEKQTSQSVGISRACCEGRDAAIREIVTALESLTLDQQEKQQS